METITGFEADRTVVKETGAIINFFKLLEQIRVASLLWKDDSYEAMELYFIFLGGKDTLRRLSVDVQEGNIDILTNTFADLYDKLQENIQNMEALTFSKDVISEEYMKLGRIYLYDSYKFASLEDTEENAYTAIKEKSYGLIPNISTDLNKALEEKQKQ